VSRFSILNMTTPALGTGVMARSGSNFFALLKIGTRQIGVLPCALTSGDFSCDYSRVFVDSSAPLQTRLDVRILSMVVQNGLLWIDYGAGGSTVVDFSTTPMSVVAHGQVVPDVSAGLYLNGPAYLYQYPIPGVNLTTHIYYSPDPAMVNLFSEASLIVLSVQPDFVPTVAATTVTASTASGTSTGAPGIATTASTIGGTTLGSSTSGVSATSSSASASTRSTSALTSSTLTTTGSTSGAVVPIQIITLRYATTTSVTNADVVGLISRAGGDPADWTVLQESAHVFTISASSAVVTTSSAQQLTASINNDAQFRAAGGQATGRFNVSSTATQRFLSSVYLCVALWLVLK